MRIRLLAFVSTAACLALTADLRAQPFPPGPMTDTTQSLGQFVLVLNPSISAAFVGVPGYTASTNTFTSPLLYDPTTQINRSTPLLLGNGTVKTSPVGLPTSGIVTSNSGDTALTFSGNTGVNAGLSYPIPSGTGATTPNTDAVFTQINAFNLNNGAGFSVTTGTSAMDPNLPASVGQVTSIGGHGSSGTSAVDFPARSFFDVFVDIDIPLPPSFGVGTTASLTNGTVYGGGGGTTAISPPGAPLIISNTGILSFPPVVIYTHGNSSAVPVYLESTNAAGATSFIGDPMGLLILAGHGAGYGQGATGTVDQNTGKPADQSTFENSIMSMYNSADTLPVPPQYSTWVTPYTPVQILPEPSSFALLAVLGGGVVAYWLRRRLRRTA